MIQQDPASLFSDVGEGGFQLKTAVAAQAEQGVAGQTLRMDAGEHRRLSGNIAIDQSNVILSGCQFFKSHHQEVAPGGWQFGFCHTFKLHVILQIKLALSVPVALRLSVCPYFATRRATSLIATVAYKD